MLTIGQLATYVGVTTRAVRHYHAIGLLPEPERDESGYRSYGAQDVVDLQRIKVLTSAGVPLARVRELLAASQTELREAVADLDRDLRAKIRDLQQTRRALAALAADTDPYAPAGLEALHDGLREIGVSEHQLAMDREGWILVQVLYPHLVDDWIAVQARMQQLPWYREMYLMMDRVAELPPDDPQLEEVARQIADNLLVSGVPDPSAGWEPEDATAYRLITDFKLDSFRGWRTVTRRVNELLAERRDTGGRSPPDPRAL